MLSENCMHSVKKRSKEKLLDFHLSNKWITTSSHLWKWEAFGAEWRWVAGGDEELKDFA